MSQLKILHVYRTYFPDPPGGLQEAIRQITLSTGQRGVENRIFTLSPSPDPAEIMRPEGLVVRARSYAAPSSCDLGSLDAFRKFSHAAKWADVVHYQFPWPFADLLHFASRHQKPTVMTYQSDIIGKTGLASLYHPLMIKMLDRMDAVVATSKAYADSSKTIAKHVEASRLHIIPLGIGEASYSESMQEAEKINLTARFGVEKAAYFLFVGVFRRYKGLANLVEAAKKTGLPVVIAGSGPEGDKLKEQASGADNIRFVGQLSDAEKMALIKGCRAAVFPSNLRSEAFGIFLLEAAMSSKPMICCDISTGTSYVNKDRTTGIVIPPDSADSLANAMKTLWENDNLVDSYGRAARDRYDRLFSDEALGRAYVSLYRSIVCQ